MGSTIIKALLTSKYTYIVIAILISGYIIYNHISNLEKVIIEKDKTIATYSSKITTLSDELVIKKLQVETYMYNIDVLREDLKKQNEKIVELEVDNDNMTIILEEHKKVKPSAVIEKKLPTNTKGNKYKGIRYEDL